MSAPWYGAGEAVAMGMDDVEKTRVSVQRVMGAHPHETLIVGPDDPIIMVARQFERKRAGIAMVCDIAGHLIGVVSLGDVVHAIGEHGAGALYFPVRMAMSWEVVTCSPGEDVESAIEKMNVSGIRHLPVVDEGRLVGFIDKPSAIETLYDEASLDFTQLRNYVFKTGGRY